MALLRVFVYGTLKPGGLYHQQYCVAHLVEAVSAIAQGTLYDFPQLGYPAMTEGDGWVQGDLLTFSNRQTLAHLDYLEDYDEHRPDHENEYQRQEITVFTPDHQPLGQAWAYFMKPQRVKDLGGILLPSGSWP
ncbi:gamma-glutamylcyclotransferase [Romeria aff. gracilis LEGE 07310]|uniref:Gamma-glutamylcyclotransferase n=1 Tax=Vasconcelosia minhoensis LEGE 07310 TaxID=915328 RepID=A0A8J7DM41_9CYAN|nr:gamma-glutamylcyclotransferase family protein [Romeria gracilis]MBE9075890.1 gamma-glutamylcyclotransferase [Romeria aff. gracilis LEGE 07310]